MLVVVVGLAVVVVVRKEKVSLLFGRKRCRSTEEEGSILAYNLVIPWGPFSYLGSSCEDVHVHPHDNPLRMRSMVGYCDDISPGPHTVTCLFYA